MYMQNLIGAMDTIVNSTVKYYKTDWTKYDRKAAIMQVLEGKPFIFIPRECGCYLITSEQERETREALFEHYKTEGGVETEGARYFAIIPNGYSDDASKLFAGEIFRGVENAQLVYDTINSDEDAQRRLFQ